VPLKTPKAVYSTSERNFTAAGGEVLVLWGGIHEWWKSEQRDWCTDWQNKLSSAWALLLHSNETGVFKDRKASSFQIGLCSDPHLLVMKFRWRLNEYCQKNKHHRWDICEEFSVWHLLTRSTGLKSVKPGMSSRFFESRDPSYVGSAMYPECRRKD